ncbi:MAG: protein kinase [Acetobacteraceae bacterium]
MLRHSLGRSEVETLNVRSLVSRASELEQQPEDPPPEEPKLPVPQRTWNKGDGRLDAGGSVQGIDGERGEVIFDIRRELGTGSFGTVYEANNRHDDSEKVAIKVPGKRTDARAIELEYRAHERALGNGEDSSHIVGLKGAIIAPDGTFQGIVLEHMSGGNVDRLLTRLAAAELRGSISHEQAQLVRCTIAKDMATGLAQLHENRSMVHYDIKPENFLISGSGVVKLADFGLTRPEAELHGEALETSTTLAFKSPELHDAPSQRFNLRREVERLESRSEQRGLTKEALSDLARSRRLRQEMDTIAVDRSSDVFSLGLSFAKVFAGTQLAGHRGAVTGAIEALGGESAARRNDVLHGLRIDSDRQDHQLIRAMLAGNPTDRPTADEIRNTALFEDPQIGSDAIRQLMFDIAKGKHEPGPGR